MGPEQGCLHLSFLPSMPKARVLCTVPKTKYKYLYDTYRYYPRMRAPIECRWLPDTG